MAGRLCIFSPVFGALALVAVIATCATAANLQFDPAATEWADPQSWRTANGTAPSADAPCSGDSTFVVAPKASVNVVGRARSGTIVLSSGTLVLSGGRLEVYPDAPQHTDATLCSVSTTVPAAPSVIAPIANVTDAMTAQDATKFAYGDFAAVQVARDAFRDTNGEVLRFAVADVTVNNRPPRHVWWTFDAHTLLFRGIPTDAAGDDLGLYRVRINATNSAGTVSASFSLALYRTIDCPCQYNATCTPFHDACDCAAGLPGFTGPLCNDSCTAAGREFKYGPNCQADCTCFRDGTATRSCAPATGVCTCLEGWENGNDNNGLQCGTMTAPNILSLAVRKKALFATGVDINVVVNSFHHEVQSVVGTATSVANPSYTVRVTVRGAPGENSYMLSWDAEKSSGLNATTTYNISVYAVNEANRAGPPSQIQITTIANSDPPPPVIIGATATDSRVNLTYSVDGKNGRVAKIKVERIPAPQDGGEPATRDVPDDGRTTHSYIDVTAIAPSTTYRYKLYAQTEKLDSWSNASNEYVVTTPAAPISPPTGSSTGGGTSVVGPVVGTLFGVVGAAGIAAGVVWYMRRQKQQKASLMAQSELALIETVSARPEITELELAESFLKIISKLGEGEFGMVHKGLATIKGEQVDVAVKTLKLNMNLTPEDTLSIRSAFMGEIDLMRSVPPHPNIVAMVAVVTLSTPNRIVLEFCDLGDLRNHLLKNSEVLTNATLVKFARDVASGMAHLEGLKIVHRDLAARNCMVKSSSSGGPIVKIGDFGLSRSVSDNDYYRVRTRGKLPVKWMAPESLEKRIFTHASDVWSFGIVMWEMWSRGAKPYPGIENHKVLDFVRAGHRPGMPEKCPADAYKIMEQCWKKHPETRPKFADLCRAIGQLSSAGEGSTAATSGQQVVGRETYMEIDLATNPGYAETMPSAM